MKNIIYIFTILVIMMACGGYTEEKSEEVYSEPDVSQKYNYSGSFEIGDRSNYDIVRQWNEAMKSENMETLSSLLSDSVSVYLWDGRTFITTKDSLMKAIKGYLDSIEKMEIVYHAGISITGTDQEDDWGISWSTESYTNAEGKEERIELQENFLIEDGKIRSVRQYAQLIPDMVEDTGSNDESEFTYSGSFVKADEGLKDVVIGWNNAVASPTDLDLAATFLADSVTIYMWNGTYINSTKDSIMNYLKGIVADMTSIEISFDALMPVHSTDRNEDWVLSWTDERYTSTAGEEEHKKIHEDYLLENGKIRLIRQYVMKDAKEEGQGMEAGEKE